MSARGGGRGGRGGGGRGGARGPPGTNWGDDLHKFVTRTPQAAFPAYSVRVPRPIDELEQRAVNRFLLFRRHVHDSPLYTRSRTWNESPTTTAMAYGRDQVNARYQPKSKATVDPFTAVESYGDRFKPLQRTLPLLSQRPFNKKIFPDELHSTLDGIDGKRAKAIPRGKKSLALPTFTGSAGGPTNEDDEEARRRVLELMAGNEENEDINDLEINLRAEENLMDDEDMDDDYAEEDDDDGNDYNAQGYWEDENNDEGDDGDGGGDGDEGNIY